MKGDNGPADALLLPVSSDDNPPREVPRFPGPAFGAAGVVVVFAVGRIDGFFDQPNSPQAIGDEFDSKAAFYFEGDGHPAVFGQDVEAFFLDAKVHWCCRA